MENFLNQTADIIAMNSWYIMTVFWNRSDMTFDIVCQYIDNLFDYNSFHMRIRWQWYHTAIRQIITPSALLLASNRPGRRILFHCSLLFSICGPSGIRIGTAILFLCLFEYIISFMPTFTLDCSLCYFVWSQLTITFLFNKALTSWRVVLVVIFCIILKLYKLEKQEYFKARFPELWRWRVTQL